MQEMSRRGEKCRAHYFTLIRTCAMFFPFFLLLLLNEEVTAAIYQTNTQATLVLNSIFSETLIRDSRFSGWTSVKKSGKLSISSTKSPLLSGE